jgi:hypothetical protein
MWLVREARKHILAGDFKRKVMVKMINVCSESENK